MNENREKRISEVDHLLADIVIHGTRVTQDNGTETTETDTILPKSTGQSCTTKTGQLDGGWGWAVATGGFIINLTTFGLNSAIGLIYVELQDNWSLNPENLQWIGSMQIGLAFALGPFTTCLSGVVSCRCLVAVGSVLLFLGLLLSSFVRSEGLLYFTLGFLPGLGNGLLIPTSLMALNDYFRKRLPLANGIVVCGSGFGGIVSSPLMEYLLEIYGHQGAILIFSAIILHTLVAAVIYIPKETTKGSRFKRFKNQMSSSFDKTLLRDSGFLLAIACHFFFHLAFFVPGGFLPNSALSYGIRKDYVPWLMSIIGLTSFIGRPVAGFLGVLFHKKIVILFGLYLVFFSLSMITMLWRTFPLLVLASALFGFTSGGSVCLCYSMIPKVVPLKLLNNSLGIILLFQGIASLLGTPLAGLFRGSFNIDRIVYIYACGTGLLGALCLLPMLYCARKQKLLALKLNNMNSDKELSDIVLKIYRTHSSTSH